MSIFQKLKRGLTKTRQSVVEQISSMTASRKLDDATLDEIEEILIQADMGVDIVLGIVEDLRARVKSGGIRSDDDVTLLIREILLNRIESRETEEAVAKTTPWVTLVVGVNGTGKTTTIGKLIHYYRKQGESILVGAADTFRAAAVDQLAIWCERNDVPLVRSQSGADPAAVVFDTLQSAQARGVDRVIIDTAGRLHNKKNLMLELEKMHRVMGKLIPDAPHEVLLVLDATTGQNALVQARLFTEAAAVTGLVLTKLDGTARGGIALAIHQELSIPVKFIGVGEGLEDLELFNPVTYVESLFDRQNDE
jgi:fused signal recognition particle receptor